MSDDPNTKKPQGKKLILFAIRWGIAILGIYIVVSNMTMRDAVLLLNPVTNLVTPTVLAIHAPEDAQQFEVKDPASGKSITVSRDRLINPPTQKTVIVPLNGKEQAVELQGMRLSGNINENPAVDELLVKTAANRGEWVAPSATVPPFVLKAPRPRVTIGIFSMVQHARPWLLVLAVLVFPINFVITSYRWNKLLVALDIRMGLARAFVINMVGAFYNSFLLGSTGGDVIKAYYAARQTTHHTSAVMSVLVDRILGLLALIILAGVMATYQYLQSSNRSDPTAQACLHVALFCIASLGGMGLWAIVMFQPSIRRGLGLEYVLSRLPMQRHVNHIIDVMRIYKRKPLLILWALIITLPVHVTTVVSALLAGKAFGLPIQSLYYFTVVPVVVLVGSIPISPQGAGVMEGFAFLLTQKQGATVNDAVALTMSVRLVQIIWNLTGGIFVLRGGYHAPTETEQKEMEKD